MQYLVADITIMPFSEAAADVLSAMLGEIGFDSFEQTETGVNAYILQELYSEESLQSVLDSIFLPDTTFSFSISELENKDWNEQWEREHFDPVLEREFGIKLNPRMAFGSGAHETTYQITSLILSLDFTSQRVLDMGTGTGVLAIAMAMKGAREVVAIDIDEFSVENAKENFSLNNIPTLSEAQVILGDASKIDGMFDTIVANIHKNILKADMATYVKHLSENGTLIISGFYHDDIDEMIEAAKLHKLKLSNINEKNSWAVLTFCKQ
ncbi:MAG: 50S ribosomal protein L11 methyltransferase [Prevotellaceae bacterium]|nr:50S ribosomal protein L11 methyltransferase [Candidatus Minthosoma caballi]